MWLNINTKTKKLLKSKTGKDLAVISIIILTSTASYGLGILSEQGRGHQKIRLLNQGAAVNLSEKGQLKGGDVIIPDRDPGGYVVASKSGSKYHFPWCAGASQIKEENKIWFNSIEEARTAGYTPAGNCKGLE